MFRTLLPLALIVLVLLGTWCIWPREETRALAVNPARVHVRYEGRGRGMFDVERQGAVLAESEVFGGTAATQDVPPGKLKLAFHFPGVEAPAELELDLAPGEEREVLFRQPDAR
ncbi:MAG: hypothetical protein IPJ19_17530 [Planctomycetes bacterium]|nr:hypothetical protein [Planctomycetota bacterium]